MSNINTSGFRPYDIGVVVKISPPKEKTTASGIILTSDSDAISIEAVQVGVLVAIGGLAFKGQEDAPKIGDEVFFAKYSGQFLYSHNTEDEQTYRVMDCHDIRLIKGA